MAPIADGPSLYLTVEVTGADSACALIEAARAITAPSAVLLVPTPGGALTAADIRVAVALAQQHAIAVLVADDAALARTLGADGVHLSPSADPLARYGEAREILGSRAIVGADAGASRHDAMTLGEAGADYIAFSVALDAGETARAMRAEQCAWWCEIFEVPCVAPDCADAAEARDLASAGAEFIGVRLTADMSPDEAADRLAEIVRAFHPQETVS